MIDCDTAADLIPLYVDNELGEGDRARLEEHLLSCESCKSKYEEIRELLSRLHDIRDVDPPDEFHPEFMKFLAEKTKPAHKARDYKRAFAAAGSAAAALIVISALAVGINGLSGQGGSQGLSAAPQTLQAQAKMEAPAAAGGGADNTFAGSSTESAPEASAADTVNSASSADLAPITADGGLSAADPSASSVTTYNIVLTVDDIQAAMDTISQFSGVQSSMNYSMPAYEGAAASASITRRAPPQDYEALKARLRALGDVTSESETLVSMARQLSDLQVQLTAKDQEKDRLLTLLGKSGDLDTMVKVETRLNSVADDSDNLNGQIRGITAQIGQPYMNIQLYNRVYAPPVQPRQPLGIRAANSFKGSVNGTVRFMQGLLLFVAAAAIPVIVCIVIVILVYLLIKLFLKRRRGGRG